MRIRSDDELLAEYCRRFIDPKLAKDRGYVREVVEPSTEYIKWAQREASRDVLAKTEELLTY